jgi:glucosamine-6-phosphate isomerase
VNIIVKDNYEGLSEATGRIIIELVNQKPDAFICLASGDSPTGTYQYLINCVNQGDVSFQKCTFIGLDEWLNIDADKPGGTKHYLKTTLFNKIDADERNIYFFDPSNPDIQEECVKMEKVISEKGPIDLLLAGIGLNGHIGLNEPGVDLKSGVHINDLAQSTITSAQKYFGDNVTLEKGITLGIQNILMTRKLVLIASGEKKASIISKALQEPISDQVPATIIQQHSDCDVILDKSAASLLNQAVTN